MHGAGALPGSEIFSRASGQYKDEADEDHGPPAEDSQLELGAAQHEKDCVEGHCPGITALENVLGKAACIAEDRAGHHADQEGGEGQLHRPQGQGIGGEGNGEQDEGDGHCQPVGSGIKELLKLCHEQAQHRAQSDRGQDLDQGIQGDRVDAQSPALQSQGDSHGDRENNQADRVIQGHDRQQQVGDRAVGLVLTDDHQGGCRRCGRGDGSQSDADGDAEAGISDKSPEQEKRRIDDGRRRQGLEDPDHKRGFSDVPHGGHAELASYGKSDKAQGGRVDDTERLDILIGGKADPAYPQPPDPVGTDQHSREQKCRHIREVRSSCFKNTG